MKVKNSYFIKLHLIKQPFNKLPIHFKYNSFIDFTYLLEKVQIQKFTKLTIKKFNYTNIQEQIFSKSIIFLTKHYFYNKLISKYNPPINLHTYLSKKFPIFIYNMSITNNIGLYELKTQINNIKNSLQTHFDLKLLKTTTINGLRSIESIFELYTQKPRITTISPTSSFILYFNMCRQYMYYLEIPIQNLLHNLNITILHTISENSIIYLKTIGTLVIGGDVLTTDRFSPSLITLYYYNTLLYSTNVYKSLKYTTIYTYHLLLESLLKQYRSQGILLPSFLFELIIKRMISYVKILKSGDTLLMCQDIVPGTLVNLINQSFVLNGLVGSLYIPVVIGISKLSLSCSGLLSSISFQETLKSLSKSVLNNRIDWVLDLKAKIIMSDLLDTGTGWYKHYNIKA